MLGISEVQRERLKTLANEAGISLHDFIEVLIHQYEMQGFSYHPDPGFFKQLTEAHQELKPLLQELSHEH